MITRQKTNQNTMETHDDEIDNLDTTSSWTSATTWTVAGGSLTNCVSFESSSPVEDDTPNSTPASTLILHPPSPDSGPCEITINFTQKHEIQQVYVRSTARVYEIYYAPDIQSDKEYLCTVRCGIAARDEEVLHTVDNEEVCAANGSLKDPSEAKSRNGNSPNNSEDDWVEVKVSDTNVLDNKINLLPPKLGSAQVKDIQPDAPPTTAYEMSASVNSTRLLPSLVVTAPGFLNGDDDEDEEEYGSDVVIGSSEKPRPALTIDDALASALAGFMSLTSTQPEKHAQTLSVKAPDVLNEEDGSVERKESTREEYEIGMDSSMCLGKTDATESIKGSLADLTKNSSEGEENFMIRSPNEEHTDKTLRVDGLDQHFEDGEEGKLDDDKSIENAVDPANRGMSKTDFCQIMEDIENGDVSTEMSNIPDPENTDVQNELPQHQIDDGYDITKKVASTDSDLTLPKEVTSHAASLVDFEIPVLAVKFTSQDSCDNGYLLLEALLAEFPESVTEAPSVKESDDMLPIVAEGCDLILVEDGEPVGAAPDSNFSVDMNLYSLGEPSSLWGDHTCNSHETF